MPLLGHHAYFFLDHQSNLSMKYAKQILQHIFLVHHAYTNLPKFQPTRLFQPPRLFGTLGTSLQTI